jgi:flavin-dependent dehydrogenase
MNGTHFPTGDSAIWDAVVVGAGLAGSSMAAALAERGWNVLLIERSELPRHKVCGEFLSPESQGILHGMGLRDAVAALAPVELTAAHLVASRGTTLDVALPGAAWGVSRHALDACLAATARERGAMLWLSSTVTAYREVASAGAERTFALTVRRRGDETKVETTVQTRSVIMACGRHSSSSLPPRATSAQARTRYVGVKCHYAGVEMPPRVELYFFHDGYAGINSVEGSRANLCLLASYDAFAAAGRSVRGMIEAARQWNPALAERLQGADPLPETECAVAPVDTHRPARPWDDVACLGDTATMIPPLCGDGMAMALRSTQLCVPLADAYLRGDLSYGAWGEAYTRAWRGEFASRLRAGRLLQNVLERPFFCGALIGLGNVAPPLANYFVHATRGHVPLETAAPSAAG